MIINEHPPGVGQALTMTTPWGMNGWWEAPSFPSRKGEPRGYCVVAIPQGKAASMCQCVAPLLTLCDFQVSLQACFYNSTPGKSKPG